MVLSLIQGHVLIFSFYFEGKKRSRYSWGYKNLNVKDYELLLLSLQCYSHVKLQGLWKNNFLFTLNEGFLSGCFLSSCFLIVSLSLTCCFSVCFPLLAMSPATLPHCTNATATAVTAGTQITERTSFGSRKREAGGPVSGCPPKVALSRQQFGLLQHRPK